MEILARPTIASGMKMHRIIFCDLENKSILLAREKSISLIVRDDALEYVTYNEIVHAPSISEL